MDLQIVKCYVHTCKFLIKYITLNINNSYSYS